MVGARELIKYSVFRRLRRLTMKPCAPCFRPLPEKPPTEWGPSSAGNEYLNQQQDLMNSVDWLKWPNSEKFDVDQSEHKSSQLVVNACALMKKKACVSIRLRLARMVQ